MTNKKLGDIFERQFCGLLAENGFWVLRVPQTADGQPFDVLAAKNGKAYAIDCKVCTKDRFVFSRVEDNQFHAMKWWEQCDNGTGWFALQFSDRVCMLRNQDIQNLSQVGSKSLHNKDILGCDLVQWLKMV